MNVRIINNECIENTGDMNVNRVGTQGNNNKCLNMLEQKI